jgi:hypothetical protein
MSKGLGQLQKRLFSAVGEADPFVSARALVVRELVPKLSGLDLTQAGDLAKGRLLFRSTDVAVRRALAGLAARGLIADLGRFLPGFKRRSSTAYATPEKAAEWREMCEQAPAIHARLQQALASFGTADIGLEPSQPAPR